MSGDDVAETISSVAIQIAFLCKTVEATISTESVDCLSLCDQENILDAQFLALLCEVLQEATTREQRQVVLCVLTALQALLRAAFRASVCLEDSAIKHLKTVVWPLVAGQTDIVDYCVQKEACVVLITGLSVFYPSSQEISAIVMDLLSEVDSATGLIVFRDLLLSHLANKFTNDSQHDTNRDLSR